METTIEVDALKKDNCKLNQSFTEIVNEVAKVKARVNDALDEGLETVRRVTQRTIKNGQYAAEDMLDDTEHEIKRHPFQSVGITFAIGLFFGLMVGRLGVGKQLGGK